jgi:hypothetical protein
MVLRSPQYTDVSFRGDWIWMTLLMRDVRGNDE